MIKEKQQADLLRLLERELLNPSTKDDALDPAVISEVELILGCDRMESKIDVLQQCFNDSKATARQNEQDQQFKMIEQFIKEEQETGRLRRGEARRMAASEEKRLAAEIASLKTLRLANSTNANTQDLQEKINSAERAYMSRKMVVAKSAQVASAECRLQFARSRVFMETLHEKRQVALEREYKSELLRLQILNHLGDKDARACALEEQVANRLYIKKKTDANEYHMAQCIEEAQYLESVLGLLDKVQAGKEEAATALLALQVEQLKNACVSAETRKDELERFLAESKLQIAKLTAECLETEEHDQEEEYIRQELVDEMERKKDYKDNNAVLSVSQLYDEVLWSVATTDLGLSSSASNTYSDFSSCLDGAKTPEEEVVQEECEAEEVEDVLWIETQSSQERPPKIPFSQMNFIDDTASNCTETTCGANGSVQESVEHRSPVGEMRMKKLMREVREQEKMILKRHKAQLRNERRAHKAQVSALKQKHQVIINELLEKSLKERHLLRVGIKQRMEDIIHRQMQTTKEVTDTVNKDLEIMQKALRAEDKRLADTKDESFVDAQNLISAQVFHEVRNALSSIIAMSEMTTSLKNDPSVSPQSFAASVDDMLCQLSEVVKYATTVLNNILDIGKIKSSNMALRREDVNLHDVVAKATMMQLSKAVKAKMTFMPSPGSSFISNTDKDIVLRILTNMIGNSLKFTVEGSVQPFIWPVEKVRQVSDDACVQTTGENVYMVAVGVADTGPGLDKETFELSKNGLINSVSGQAMNHGVRNSGFGLHLCHLLAQSLGTELHLSDLRHVFDLLSDDTKKAVVLRNSQEPVQYQGTVLYFTLPVYKSTPQVGADLEATGIQSSQDVALQEQFVFSPRPSPSSKDGTFRILVADDVLMLRKGMLNTITTLFSDCPVSISTACSAEDMRRAIQTNPYDLVISDNLFHHDPANLRLLSPHQEEKFGRPRFVFNPHTDTRVQARKDMTEFFRNESFTVREGDGNLLGVEAVVQLSQKWDSVFPMPVLMLLSGHKISIPESHGIVVARKPLKQGDLASILEAAGPNLLDTDHCTEATESVCTPNSTSESSASESRVIAITNRLGARLFEKKCFTAPES